MKQPKRLTRDQKEIVKSHGLNPDNWMLVCETKLYFHLIHKETNTKKMIEKSKKGKKK